MHRLFDTFVMNALQIIIKIKRTSRMHCTHGMILHNTFTCRMEIISIKLVKFVYQVCLNAEPESLAKSICTPSTVQTHNNKQT